MLSVYFFSEPIYWVIPWIFQMIGYYFILKKMELKKWTAIVPPLAEWQLSSRLFNKRRSFFRPVVISVIFILAAWYLDPYVGMGRIFMRIVFVIYGIFIMRLYGRMAKAFGKKKIFALGLIILPPLFLMILGLSKKAYFTQPEFKPEKERSKAARIARRVIFAAISVAEVLVIIAGVSFVTVRTTAPEPLVSYLLEDAYNRTKDITGTGDVVSREDVLGEKVSDKDIKGGRDYFFPDHSKDKNVVVMAYIVGSNLEDKAGLASANITQMIEATKQGDGLKFVIEAGGSKRWFTKGIDDESYGRYEIADGKIQKVEALPDNTCMSKGKNLSDFIIWAKEKYKADRYMLVMWDHGGGVGYGYGQDELNISSEGIGTISVSDVVKAIDRADLKFDMIGFDACLMQDIEIAKAMEPYADFYLASEETEGGYGWYYTAPFGMLAENPAVETEKFGREMIACYDPYNRIIKNENNEPDTKATLSFVDLTLVTPAYDKFTKLLDTASEVIKEDVSAYADMAVSADNAYNFEDDMQIDLIGFLKILKKTDYNETIMSEKEKAELIRSIQACILYRNGDSAKGIHGMSVAFPYKNMGHYDATSKELKALSLKSEKQTFDEIFSVMAAQKKKKHEEMSKDDDIFEEMLMEQLGEPDYTKESWYIEGFENYDDTRAFVNIPLKEAEDGYMIELPDKAWKLVADCQTMVYQKTDPDDKDNVKGAATRYLGKDQIGGEDKNGHPTVAMDDYWVYVGSQLVCYEAEPVRVTEEGNVYTGKIRARLNGEEDISLNVEWDPVDEESDIPATGHITGYDDDSLLSFLNTKGSVDLQAGDTLQFLFDYYDKEGNLIKTKPAGGVVRVSKQARLKVTDKPLPPCEIQFGGVLTDVYQRVMTTEQLEMKID